MAIHFKTNDPGKLLSTFKKYIDDKKVVTWSYDTSGDFTHTPDQWIYRAWLRPSIENGQLVMNIIRPKNGKVPREVYGVYHGRFIESMLSHCDSLFTEGIATALATKNDLV
jgi:hypothetical protein